MISGVAAGMDSSCMTPHCSSTSKLLQNTQSSNPPNGVIRVKAVERENGKTIAGLGVDAWCMGAFYAPVHGTTNTEGRVDFTGLPPCHYFVYTRGFASGEWLYTGTVYPDSTTPSITFLPYGRVGTPIEIDANRVANIEFALDRSASIVVNLVSTTPFFLWEATAYSADTGLPAVNFHSQSNSETGTLSTSFRLGGLKPGRYYFVFEVYALDEVNTRFKLRSLYSPNCGLPYCMSQADVVTLAAGEHLPAVDVHLQSAPMEGAVLTATGDAVLQNGFYNSRVDLFAPNGDLIGWLDPWNGGFSEKLDFGLPSDYLAVLTPTNRVDSVAPHSTFQKQLFNGINCGLGQCPLNLGITPTGRPVMTPQLAGTIRGYVADPRFGTGLPYTKVNLHDQSGGVLISRESSGRGAFAFTGLPTGSYFVSTENHFGRTDQVWRGNRCGIRCDPLTGEPIDIIGSETVDLEAIYLQAARFFSSGFG